MMLIILKYFKNEEKLMSFLPILLSLSPLKPPHLLLDNLELQDRDLIVLEAYLRIKNWMIESLSLRGNRLTKVPDFSFLPEVTRLNLSYNQITEIPDFSSLPHLEYLDLGHNQITEISDFTHLNRLKSIDLYMNRLTQVPTFSASVRLEKINLNGNQITKLDTLCFPQLKSLHLHQNCLTDVSAFSNGSALPELEDLDLSWNQLTRVPLFSFNLKSLNLDGNRLTEPLDATFLSSLPALKAFNLNGVRIPDHLYSVENYVINRCPVCC